MHVFKIKTEQFKLAWWKTEPGGGGDTVKKLFLQYLIMYVIVAAYGCRQTHDHGFPMNPQSNNHSKKGSTQLISLFL